MSVKENFMKSEKGPLPRGMSFVLKPSILAQALAEAELSVDTHLVRGVGGIFFDAHFWPPNENVGYERLYVRAGAVANSLSQAARLYVENTVLPKLTAWLADILALPVASPIRREKQYFRVDLPEQLGG
ncbi:hypothetical protein V3W47_05320 [Deinococcus sp. YIM 134068]|uniref:hypothetical protein n=1 Tax=Deinococcus lichenicola TaxID=3118910 RepID=UPI002F93B77E